MRRICVSSVSRVAACCYTTFPDLKKPESGTALPKLQYEVEKGISPVISSKQLNLHYNKHHKAYVDKLNQIAPAKYHDKTIEEIVTASAKVPEEKVLYNQAAQHFNHTFFWHCLKPNGSDMPEALKKAIEETFKSVDDFKKEFAEKAVGNFGSGWTWLVYDPKNKKLAIENTGNAGCPVADGKVPIFTVDVWEHAYYVDFENRRPDFVKEVWKIANWEFVAKQLEAAKKE